MNFFIKYFNYRKRILVLLIGLMACCSNIAIAQFYPPTILYRAYPNGDLCGPQTITVHLQYWGPNSSFHGQVRWFADEWGSTPVETDYIDYNTPVDYNFYAFPGQTISYEVYDANVPGWSQRMYYTPDFSVNPTITYNQGTHNCTSLAQIHVRSDVPGTTFELYSKNGFDSYFLEQTNETGDFELGNFNPVNKDDYYVKLVSPYPFSPCTVPNDYVQVPFTVTYPPAPVVTGNLTWCEGSPPVLTASGPVNYSWFDVAGNLLYWGAQFTPSATLAAGTYKFVARGDSYNCYTYTEVTATINPKPVDGTVTADGWPDPVLPNTVFTWTGETVTFTGSGGVGEHHYWGSSNGGTTWDLFADAFANQNTFEQVFTTPGTYRVHMRNKTTCGFCWDNAGGCTTFPYIDVTVRPVDDIVLGPMIPDHLVFLQNSVTNDLDFPTITGGTNTWELHWQRSYNSNFEDPEDWYPIQYHSSPAPPTDLAGTYYYRLIVSSGKGIFRKTAVSGPVRIDIVPNLSPNSIIPAEIVTPSGKSPGVITAGAARGGLCNGNYQYQWQQSTDGTNFTDISQAQGLTYEPPALFATMYYRRKATCGTEDAYTNVCHVTIGNITVQNINFLRTRAFERPGILDRQTADGIASVAEVKQSTDYYDGLGRKMQSVIKQGSKNSNAFVDIVSPVVYDEFGREAEKWLPYASSASDGDYKLNPMKDVTDFYKIQEPNEKFYYSQTDLEASPLNRVMKTMAPGDSWTGGNRGVESKYNFNTGADGVRIWNVTGVPNGLATYSSPSGQAGIYPTGALYKNITVDEKGAQVVEFKDKQGLLILKRVQVKGLPDDGHTGWLCTYYIYDDRKNLRCVVQPRGVELLANNNWDMTALNGDILNEQCFRYEYDHLDRMTMKKVPGAGVAYMVYDKRDRMVMSQDAKLHNLGKWQVTSYDNLNRPVATGLWVNNTAFSNHLLNAAVSNNYPSAAMLANGYELLTETHYDDYNDLPTGLTSTLNNNWGSNFITTYNTAPEYAQEMLQSQAVKGLVGWMRVKVLGTANQFLSAVNIYDKYGQLIQVKSINLTGETDIVSTQYDFAGKVLRTALTQVKAAPNGLTTSVYTKNAYDELSRPTKLEKNINGSGWKVVVSMDYDVLGRLKHKLLGTKPGTTTAEPLETLTYDYNIRDWLLGVNREYLAGNQLGNYFGFEIGYDRKANKVNRDFIEAQYNGNLSGMAWKSKGDGIQRKYDYSYDDMNRLLKADFIQHNTDGSWNNSQMNFDVKMGDGLDAATAYDANGNIRRMKQWGVKGLAPASIDDLTYNYTVNGQGTQVSNKLYKVSDAFNDPDTKLGDFKDGTIGGDDYTYDENGNLTVDNNRGISSIVYNHLDLLQLMTIPGKGTIEFTYDASGNKLQKVAIDGDLKTTTKYMMGFEYESKEHTIPVIGDYTEKLSFIPHEEGRIRPGDNAALYYDFLLKDHLGNVRAVITEQNDQHKNYVATMEHGSGDEVRNNENQLFSNLNVSEYPAQTAGFPGSGSAADPNPNEFVAHVNGNTQKKGPAIVLKVMAGDVVDLGVKYLYHSNSNPGPTGNVLSDILSSLAGGIVSASGVAKGTLAELSDPSNSPLLGALQTFRGANNQDIPSKPKAYLNWILLDEQLKNVGTVPQSNAMAIGDAEQINTLSYTGIDITKNGYLYIYVSNETENWDVFFDDLAVTHHAGPLLEETHYYPFGLTMAAISSKALKDPYAENKRKYNGIELVKDLGIDIYDAQLRDLDPQLGRWWQIDPEVEGYENVSPYNAMNDAPIRYSDPLGDEADEASGCCLGLKKAFASISGAVIGTIDNNIPGSNLRGAVASSGIIEDAEVAESWNKALDVADDAGIVQGVGEGTAGGGLLSTSVAVTAGTGGFSIEVTGPTAAIGGGMVLHGGFVAAKSVGNLTSQNGRVNVNKSSSSSTSNSNSSTSGSNGGRNGKQAKLREIKNDPKASSSDRGWLKQDQNSIDKGKRTTLRVPPGKNLAHSRGKEARKGFSYKESKIQDIDLHKLQHRTERKKQ